MNRKSKLGQATAYNTCMDYYAVYHKAFPYPRSLSIYPHFSSVCDTELMKESGIVRVDRTDIGLSDHFLVWGELARTTKCAKKGNSVTRRWRLVDDEVKRISCRSL